MKYVNEIENKITIKIKAGYYLQLLTPETMKLFGSTKSKIIKHEIGEDVPHLEITEVVLIDCNIVNKFKDFCTHLFLINHLVSY